MRNYLSGSICKVVLAAFVFSLLLGGIVQAGGADANGKVDLNSATVKELSSLPGIGKKKAEAIIAFREANGGFGGIDELKSVDGIGKKTFEKIKERITAGDG